MNGSQALTTNPPSGRPLRSAGRLEVCQRHQAILAIERHWPEYLMEAAELGLFMVSACSFTVLLEHPESPARLMLPSSLLRMLSFAILGSILKHPSVNFAVTRPGSAGVPSAFIAELIISFVLALTVLSTSNDIQLSRFTPYFAAMLVVAYITLEAPFSGMSMKPRAHARLRSSGTFLSCPLDLFHGSAHRNVACRGIVLAAAVGPSRLLRQISPQQLDAVHFPLPLRGAAT